MPAALCYDSAVIKKMRISYFNKLDGGSNKIFNWRSHS